MKFLEEHHEIIVGIHSVVAALLNGNRQCFELLCTESSFIEIKKRIPSLESRSAFDLKIMNTADFLRTTESYYRSRGFVYRRLTTHVCLVAEKIPIVDFGFYFCSSRQKNKKFKYICLDQITDIHNAAALMRTAAFYKVDALIFSQKGSFTVTPSFTRLASGSMEYVKMINCHSLCKGLRRLEQLGVRCVGFSEHEKEGRSPEVCGDSDTGKCLVFGSEERGLSFAVRRVLPEIVTLKSQGQILSLNVSVAAGIAMDRFFPA